MEYLVGPDSAIPIAVGADRPAKGLYSHAYHVHGSDGLGISLPSPTSQAAYHERGRVLARTHFYVPPANSPSSQSAL